MKKIWMSAVSIVLPLCFTALIHAAVPQTISYQGYLKDANGPVSNQVTLTFRLYDSIAANSPIWADTLNVTPQNGIYSVQLGSENPLASTLDIGPGLYLGIQVGAEPEMSPRQQLHSVPYALRSSQADAVISNSIGTEAITDSSITTSKLADGAVTNAQISGTITADKLDLSTVQKKYGKVAVVAQSGGDYTSPVAAMADSAAWCGAPSADNPCLLKIMPGVYDLGAGSLAMQQYIDIEGSGEQATIITSAVDSGSFPVLSNGTVNGASNAELKYVSLKNSGAGQNSAGMVNSGNSPRLRHVAITVSGAASSNVGIFNRTATSTIMDGITITVTGGSGFSYGIYNSASSKAAVNNASITVSNATLRNYGLYFDNSFEPAVNNVTVRASGGSESFGVYNSSSDSIISNLSVVASGQTTSYAVYNSNSFPVMRDVTAATENGTTGYGIYNSASAPVMTNVDASAIYNTNGYGMYNNASSGSYQITADRSSFTGNSYSIFNDTEFVMRIGASRLSGPSNSLGTYTYLASYGDTAALAAATTGTQIFQTGADSSTGLVVKANSGNQSANLQEWQKSNGTVAASVSADGIFTGDASGLSNMKYGKTAIVAQSGGNYTSPLAAMSALASWCGIPSAANPCLLKILPGEYNLGAGTLAMQPYVDIEGSGENATIITSTASNGSSPPANGTVNGAANAEIRLLSVRNNGGGASAAGMVNSAGATPRVTNISISATGAANVNYGVYNNASAPVFASLTVSAAGGNINYGMYNDASSPSLSNSTANAAGGNSAYGVFNFSSSNPAMNNVAANAAGAANNAGIYNNSSSPAMNGITASASGGTLSYGVYNLTSSPTMNNIISKASATGPASASHGVYNLLSSTVMVNVIAEATGAANTYGMYNLAAGVDHSISIDRCSFSGATNSIRNDPGYTLRIGASKLIGPVNDSGSYLYLASYSDTATLGSSTVGTQTIQTGADTGKGLIVKGNSVTQSANLQEWQNSSGVVVASVSAAGVLTGDGSGLSGVQKKPGRTAVVATSGGDYSSPVTAMNNRATWCSAPSASSPCLLKIMPGTYDLGDVSLVMQPYVDIEGSGERATIITSAVGTESLPPTGTVVGASNAEIRFLTIRNTGAGIYIAGMINNNVSPRMRNISVTVSGGDTSSYGVYFENSPDEQEEANMDNLSINVSGKFVTGIYCRTSSPTMNQVNITTDGTTYSTALDLASSAPLISNSTFSAFGALGSTGVLVNNNVSLAMNNVNVTARGSELVTYSYGLYVDATNGPLIVDIDRSSIEGGDYSIVLLEGDLSTWNFVNIGASKLNGPTSGNNSSQGGIYCANSYSSDYVALDQFCGIP